VKSLTIRLPERLIASIEAEARGRKVSKSDVVRARLKEAAPAAPSTSIWATAGPILERGWAATVPAGPPVFGSRAKQKLAALVHAKKLRH